MPQKKTHDAEDCLDVIGPDVAARNNIVRRTDQYAFEERVAKNAHLAVLTDR